MKEYEGVTYLDLQKTGSGTIKTVLDGVLVNTRYRTSSHTPLPDGFDRSQLFFISIREPLALYISLFSFAAGNRKGALFRSLSRNGQEKLLLPTYDGFETWLRFVLDPKNAHLVIRSEYAESSMAEKIGILSFRLLYLSIPRAMQRMRSGKFQTPDEIRSLFEKRVYREYVRTENLDEDLFAFLKYYRDRLRFRRPLTTVQELTAQTRRKNKSIKVEGLSPDTVSPELRALVRERDWLIYEMFGYDRDPKGRPPNCLTQLSNAEDPPEPQTLREMRRERRQQRRKTETDPAD